MKEYTTENIRNIVLTGHMSCGKTSLVEAMLYQNMQIARLGKTEEGNTASDYDPEEIKHHYSILAALLPVEYKHVKMNVLDCPGNNDFVGEIKTSIRMADLMLMVIDATSGVEVGSEFAFDYGDEYQIPMAAFINKMDKEHANFENAMNSISTAFGIGAVAVTLPIGAESSFSGVIDLLRMKAIKEKPGGKATVEDIPAEMADAADEARAALVEAAAEGDETIMEKFLNDEELTPEEVINGLKGVVIERRFIPVLCGASTQCIGIEPLLEFLSRCAPSPADLSPVKGLKGEEQVERAVSDDQPTSAFVFKTISDNFLGKVSFFKVMSGVLSSDSSVHNVTHDRDEKIGHLLAVMGKKSDNIDRYHAGDIGAVAKLANTGTNDTLVDGSEPIRYPATKLPPPSTMAAIVATNKSDEEKLGVAINRVTESDATLTINRDPEVRQTIMSGMGDTHLEVAAERIRSIAKVDIELVTPRVPYRETITKQATGNYRHKKQSGGRGQFGEVYLRLEPLPEGSGFEFLWEVVGGNIPTKFQASVEKGIHQAMDSGFIAGCKVVDIRVACYDGKDHPVDSSDMAFQIAASMGFRQIAQQANPILLEPIMKATITVPDSNMGDVMGSISSRRGRPLGSEQKGNKTIINAEVPMAEMFDYSRELRSMTQGRGVFYAEFARYERVPPEVQEKIVQEYQTRKEEGDI